MKQTNQLIAEQAAHAIIPQDSTSTAELDYSQQWQIALDAALLATEKQHAAWKALPWWRRLDLWGRCDECETVLLGKSWCTTCGDNEVGEGAQDTDDRTKALLAAFVSVACLGLMIWGYVAL